MEPAIKCSVVARSGRGVQRKGNQYKEAKAKEAALRQQRSKGSKTVTVAERLCLKPGETKDVSPRCDDMKQDGVLRSSGEIFPYMKSTVLNTKSSTCDEFLCGSRDVS
ncbi:unnamed protein product [Heligmosomoides polygyrus]|uniref:UPF0390 protein n=1 Tax=Heligmosomoides polygyrus TaxID=6339 RepID=A0A183GA90_HELPZ|nr:unnamed protein product [Heligmosomoides polygyrus]